MRWTRWGLILLLAWGVFLVRPPEPFREGEAAGNVRVLARDGSVLYESRPFGAFESARSGPSSAFLEALVATEDRRLLMHPGVDPRAVLRAACSNVRAGTVVSGASTLAMQVARMRRGGARTTWRTKVQDALLAVRLTMWYGPASVLHEWSSRAFFGRRAYGIEAAADAYFGKAASDLSLAEATFLVGLPQRPSDYPRSREAARQRQQRVLDALVRDGRLSAEEASQTLALPLDLVDRRETSLSAPHLAMSLMRAWPDEAEIPTTLDPDLQQRVEALARAHRDALASRRLGNVAVLVLDNASGQVRAYLGSADYFDAGTQGANDGVRMLRQPGSALKPFVYAEAMERGGLSPATLLADIETPFVDEGAAFSAQNYDRRYHGPVSAREALASSFNVPAVRLARSLGPESVLDRLRAFGLTSLSQPADHYGVGIALGNGEVSLWELTSAYAALARGGLWCRSSVLPADEVTCRRSLSRPETAFLITDILSDPQARRSAFGRGGPLEFDFPAAAKTGTSKDYRDNWALAYTPAYTVGVWAGNFDGSPMQDVAGVRGAGTLLHAIVETLGPGGAFEVPPSVTTKDVCGASGELPGKWCLDTRTELFGVGRTPTDTCSVHRAYPIDVRTGLLASHQTPIEHVAEQVFAVYPAEFRSWMVANGLPVPPPAPADSTRTSQALLDPAMRILYPPDGTIYQLDPVLRSEYQRIRLRAALPPNRYGAHWLVDGERIPAVSVDSALLSLSPGRHRLQLSAYDEAGRPVASAPAIVRVLPVTPLPDAR